VRNNVFVSIGIGAMVVVLYAVAASLTLLPAVLSLVGRGINWVRVPFLGKAHVGAHLWGGITHAVQRRPVVFVVAAAGLLLAAAVPLTTIDLGSNGIESLPHETKAYQGIKALQRDFAGGRVDPLLITVDGADTPAAQAGIARFQQEVAGRSDLQWMGVTPDPTGRTALIEIAERGSGTGAEAQQIVHDLRTDLVPQAFKGTDATVHVGGNISAFVDVKAEMDHKTPVVFGFVLGLSFLLLLLVFRSVVIPAKAILMNLLSVGAAYGLIVLVFQHGFLAKQLGFVQVDQVEFWIPLFLFSILFGLSMDYHVFLLSRVQEEYHRTGDNTRGVRAGVTSTAGMITSAAVIMVAVFAGFARGQLVSMQQMGFGLAVAVFMDATIIRSVLVPASMQLLGRYNWWFPRWLAWLPRITVEGAAHDEPAQAVPAPVAVAAGD
jgi:RND superfamily putative drug exporter